MRRQIRVVAIGQSWRERRAATASLRILAIPLDYTPGRRLGSGAAVEVDFVVGVVGDLVAGVVGEAVVAGAEESAVGGVGGAALGPGLVVVGVAGGCGGGRRAG
jgi:hypothetical protein